MGEVEGSSTEEGENDRKTQATSLGKAKKGKVWDYDIGDWADFVGDQALIESQMFGRGGLVVKDGVVRAAPRH